jgi:TIR domain
MCSCSYAREDLPFVRRLTAALRARNREVWVDLEDVIPSARWPAEIRTAITEADAVAFVITPDSVASEVCRTELDYATEASKRLVPIIARETSPDGVPAVRYFTILSRARCHGEGGRLVKRAGRPHVVYVSIVGVDRIPYGYYQAKLAAETLVRDCGLPWTLLRATQFHDLVLQIVTALAKPPVVVVPRGMAAQPVDTREVAQRLALLALGEPTGRVRDFGGPRVWSVGEATRAYLAAADLRRRIVGVPLPGRAARAFRAGWNLVRDGETATRTFEEFLAQRVQPGGRVQLTYHLKQRG